MSTAAPQPSPVPSNLVLRQVIVLMRHGDRSPVSMHLGRNWAMSEAEKQYWKVATAHPKMLETLLSLCQLRHAITGEPLNVPKNRSGVLGLITTRGVGESLRVGSWLRQRYVEEQKLLPATLDPSVLYSRTTCVPRTVYTAAAVLTGLYPPPLRTSGVDLPTIHTRNSEYYDTLLPARGGECPAQVALFQLVRAEQEKRLTARELEILEFIRKRFDGPAGVHFPVTRTHELLNCQLEHSLPLAGGITPGMVEEIRVMNDSRYRFWYSSPEHLRLSIGRFLGELLDMMEQRALGNGAASGIRLGLFCAHDITLMPVSAALGDLDETGWFGYNSSIVFELFEETSPNDGEEESVGADHRHGTGTFFVRVLKADRHGHVCVHPLRCSPKSVKQNGSGWEFVPLSRLAAQLRPLVPQNYEEECTLVEDPAAKVVVTSDAQSPEEDDPVYQSVLPAPRVAPE